MWEYCVLLKMDMEEAGEEMDEVDSMRIEDFNRLEAFFSANSTFPIAEDEVILDVFRFRTFPAH